MYELRIEDKMYLTDGHLVKATMPYILNSGIYYITDMQTQESIELMVYFTQLRTKEQIEFKVNENTLNSEYARYVDMRKKFGVKFMSNSNEYNSIAINYKKVTLILDIRDRYELKSIQIEDRIYPISNEYTTSLSENDYREIRTISADLYQLLHGNMYDTDENLSYAIADTVEEACNPLNNSLNSDGYCYSPIEYVIKEKNGEGYSTCDDYEGSNILSVTNGRFLINTILYDINSSNKKVELAVNYDISKSERLLYTLAIYANSTELSKTYLVKNINAILPQSMYIENMSVESNSVIIGFRQGNIIYDTKLLFGVDRLTVICDEDTPNSHWIKNNLASNMVKILNISMN